MGTGEVDALKLAGSDSHHRGPGISGIYWVCAFNVYLVRGIIPGVKQYLDIVRI